MIGTSLTKRLGIFLCLCAWSLQLNFFLQPVLQSANHLQGALCEELRVDFPHKDIVHQSHVNRVHAPHQKHTLHVICLFCLLYSHTLLWFPHVDVEHVKWLSLFFIFYLFRLKNPDIRIRKYCLPLSQAPPIIIHL
ncbi:hypothetical protein P256_01995 [Acinetobacter nectaris CIP 110549]|uniref:Uncharacterized protein n=1 Tax=Acinetobacter nectaris CIP 110549 TaxID=1392540 RepID=V2TL24_9GAMM|nr:hypothetical protein P256_01995 [Acinetobacter nectaris CIP 110549]